MAHGRQVLVGAVHPSHWLPVALGLIWCLSFAAAAVFGFDDTGDARLVLRVFAVVGAVAGVPLLGFVTTAVLVLTDHGVRIERRLQVCWSDVTGVSIEVRDENADIRELGVPDAATELSTALEGLIAEPAAS